MLQIPPKYSAKNVNGQRGYQLARGGVEFELPPKRVTIKSIKLLNELGYGEFSFEIECGGGTYIRSIARDMAAKLGTFAAMSALKRTRSGPFLIENSVSTDLLDEENLHKYFIPCDSVLPLESIYAEGETAKKIFNGVCVNCNYKDGLYKLYNAEKSFYGLAEVAEGILKVRTKLC